MVVKRHETPGAGSQAEKPSAAEQDHSGDYGPKQILFETEVLAQSLEHRHTLEVANFWRGELCPRSAECWLRGRRHSV